MLEIYPDKNDNDGKPRRLYVEKLESMSVDELSSACEQMIWMSAYAANNRRSDYHWQCDACWNECQRRALPDIYSNALARASRQ